MKKLLINRREGAALCLAIGMCLFSSVAMASGLQSQAEGLLKDIYAAIYAIVGIVATIALLWQCAQGFMGRKEWSEVFTACLWIFAAGGASVFATWLFESGSQVSL